VNVGKGTVNRRFMQITIDRVGLLVDEVALMQIFFPPVLRFYSVGIILLLLYTHNLNPKTTLENCALLGHDAAQSGNFLPTFRNNTSVSFSRMILEDGTHRFSSKRQ